MADDFCKEFAKTQEKYMALKTRIICFKHYYQKYVCKHPTHLFPQRVSYNRLGKRYCCN